MRSVEFNYRLLPGASAEQEWLYLINESYIGERCIVPLLGDLLDAPVEGVGFRRMITRQIAEEEEHVARYAELLGDAAGEGSGYDQEFSQYVRALPNTTLKLYALQALLEGVSLGALRYRNQALASGPSQALDRRVQIDEQRHTRFGRAFLEVLCRADGTLPRARFDRVAKEVNAIFARHFNGARLALLMRNVFGVDMAAEQIDASPGMKKFRIESVHSLLESKAEFLGDYHAATSRAV